MAAVSPYVQNDYQPLSNLRPYELPVNDIMKAITAQNQFWDEGALRVKNVYEHSLGLSLTNTQNKEIRDKFMIDADKQLAKLSTMDLRDPDVQRQGFGIYKPLLKDRGIISDSAATDRINKINSEALGYRNKDKGVGYNQYNHEYALTGAKEFENSEDRFAGEAYMEQAKNYEPYYDYNKEISTIMKDCSRDMDEEIKPTYQGANNDQMTGYQHHTKHDNRTTAKSQLCLERLSSKALRQMQIEGVVNYKNKEVLAQDVISYTRDHNLNISTELMELYTTRTAIRTSKEYTEEEKSKLLKAIDTKAKQYKETLTENSEYIEKLKRKEYDSLTEEVAGNVYAQRLLIKNAAAFTITNEIDKYEADLAQLQQIKILSLERMNTTNNTFEETMETIKQKNRIQLERIKATLSGNSQGGGTSAFSYGDNGNPIVNPELQKFTDMADAIPKEDPHAFDKLKADLADANTIKNMNSEKLFQNMINRGDIDPEFRKEILGGFANNLTWDMFKASNNKFSTYGSNGKRVITTIDNTGWFKALLKNNPNLNPKDGGIGTFIHEWKNTNANANLAIGSVDVKLKLGEQDVRIALGLAPNEDVNKKVYDSIKDLPGTLIKVSPTSSIKFTPNQIADALAKGQAHGNDHDKILTSTGLVIRKHAAFRGMGAMTYSIYFNGQPTNASTMGNTQDIIDATEEAAKELTKARAKVYGKLGFVKGSWWHFSDTKGQLITGIKNRLGDDGKDVSIVGLDYLGGIKISHPGLSKSKTLKDFYLKKLQLGTEIEFEGDEVTIHNTSYNTLPMFSKNPLLQNAAFQLASTTRSSEFKEAKTGQKIENATMPIPTIVGGESRTMIIEAFKEGPEQIKFTMRFKEATAISPTIVAYDAYHFVEELAKYQQDINK